MEARSRRASRRTRGEYSTSQAAVADANSTWRTQSTWDTSDRRIRWSEERDRQQRPRDRPNRIAVVRPEEGPESEDDETCETRVAVIDHRRESQGNRQVGRDPKNESRNNKTAPHRNGDAKAGDQRNDRAPTYIDFKKLLKLTTEDAKKAWPTDVKLSAVHPEFLYRPIDRANNIWDETACKHCMGQRLPADHNPLRCARLKAFLANTPSLQHLLVKDFALLRDGTGAAEGGSAAKKGGGYAKATE